MVFCHPDCVGCVVSKRVADMFVTGPGSFVASRSVAGCVGPRVGLLQQAVM